MNCIRSYVLNPSARVRDLRTGIERSDAAVVLDGDIDKFLEAALAERCATVPTRLAQCRQRLSHIRLD